MAERMKLKERHLYAIVIVLISFYHTYSLDIQGNGDEISSSFILSKKWIIKTKYIGVSFSFINLLLFNYFKFFYRSKISE